MAYLSNLSLFEKVLKFDLLCHYKPLQVEIEFEQLVQLAKKLPAKQWTKLKNEIDKAKKPESQASELEAFLLTAPTFSKKQLEEIDKARKAINQWRTK